jgi:hypothetical protein
MISALLIFSKYVPEESVKHIKWMLCKKTRCKCNNNKLQLLKNRLILFDFFNNCLLNLSMLSAKISCSFTANLMKIE